MCLSQQKSGGVVGGISEDQIGHESVALIDQDLAVIFWVFPLLLLGNYYILKMKVLICFLYIYMQAKLSSKSNLG